ncbi:MAG: hypothetical protein LUD47_07150 [Clostridia bacterium]|nr:hypothetical protein [Clostridia bacterium]
MRIFYVNQGKTYYIERSGGYVWSPQKALNGQANIGFSTMRQIHKGDYILHCAGGYLLSISRAKTDCYVADQPSELVEEVGKLWDKHGYRVDVEYYNFDSPMDIRAHSAWLAAHYDPRSAFTYRGTGKQQYMCNLVKEHAIYILNQLILLQRRQENKQLLSYVLNLYTGGVSPDSEWRMAWNHIVDDHIQNLYRGNEENKKIWNDFLCDPAFFGYNKELNEVTSGRRVVLGDQELQIPYFVVRDSLSAKDLFVMDVKRYDSSPENQDVNQLNFCLRRFGVNYSVLVCDRIYIYKKTGISNDISFTANSMEGVKFLTDFNCNNMKKASS